MLSVKNVLITGATGNIGIEVIRYLYSSQTQCIITAGVRNIESAKKILGHYEKLQFVYFDFENPDTFTAALKNMDCIYIVRPPQISDTDKYFKPFIQIIKQYCIPETIFLSVQGAEKSKVIPHHKIEKLIMENQLNYVFLRPGYFMQNLTTTLLSDIKQKRQIILPAGKAKFNWIDVENIGEVSAIVINKFQEFKNNAFEVTGNEIENFYTVETLMNKVLSNRVTYAATNPFKFYALKKKEGMNKSMILVMIMLHFLPRFQKLPRISNFYTSITNKKPTGLLNFIEREKDKFN